MSESFNPHGTTILGVRRKGVVAIGGDGQVTLGTTVMKGNARKVRPLGQGKVLGGFAGGTADAFTLFERFEGKLDKFGNLTRAAIELAKDWRSDRYLRRLEALLLEGYEAMPKLYDDLVDQRNRRWIPQVKSLLSKENDTLVVVGALHLVGDRGLIALLKREGLKIERYTASGKTP